MKPRVVLVAGVLAAAASVVGSIRVQAEDEGAADIRAQIGRFWMITEDQVRADFERRPAARQPEVSCTVVQPPCSCQGPAPVYPRPSCRPCQPPVYCAPPVTVVHNHPAVPPRLAVEMNQSAGSSKHRGDWGLDVLGSLPVFRFTWGDEGSNRNDSLHGNL